MATIFKKLKNQKHSIQRSKITFLLYEKQKFKFVYLAQVRTIFNEIYLKFTYINIQ